MGAGTRGFSMQARLLTGLSALIASGFLMQGAALAQGAKPPPKAPEWSTVTKEAAPGAREFDARQLELIRKVTAYFNQMGDMKGLFLQIGPDGKKLRGKIYIKRPSFFRFEYNLPSRQLIISDGTSMAIQDLDLKTDDRYSLDKTIFRIVLRNEVDLARDARILDVGETETRYFLTMQDKDPNAPGRLKLLLTKRPAMELREWISTDSQGLDTHVELVDFGKAENLDKKLFEPPQVFIDKLKQ
jgi:outer membrane lipoprotein-sorting protein